MLELALLYIWECACLPADAAGFVRNTFFALMTALAVLVLAWNIEQEVILNVTG